jgi:hypothetical protein
MWRRRRLRDRARLTIHKRLHRQLLSEVCPYTTNPKWRQCICRDRDQRHIPVKHERFFPIVKIFRNLSMICDLFYRILPKKVKVFWVTTNGGREGLPLFAPVRRHFWRGWHSSTFHVSFPTPSKVKRRQFSPEKSDSFIIDNTLSLFYTSFHW